MDTQRPSCEELQYHLIREVIHSIGLSLTMVECSPSCYKGAFTQS